MELLLVGHASKELGEHGDNILCAGISTLSQACFLYLQKRGYLSQIVWKSGQLGFRIENPTDESEICMQILRTGILDLQSQYPNEIQYSIGEEHGT